MDSERPPGAPLEPRAALDQAAYVIPRYLAPAGSAFFHFLHGTVPGHQIDFMYCPEVPQGSLAQTHVGHLSRLMKYIEPRSGAAYAFALGNLSRDDVQHEPGHGGMAVLFALRVPGVTDHAGRDMPPYAHGIVAVDRALDFFALKGAIEVLYGYFLGEGAEHRGDFYRDYVRMMEERPDQIEAFLAHAISRLDDLPQPPRSRLGYDFVQDAAALPKRITLVHEDDERFDVIAHCAALLGSVLYRSNIKWTSITTGREIDIPGGTTVRFVPKSDVTDDPEALMLSIDELAQDEDELLYQLFGARRRTAEVTAARRQGWREKLAAQRGSLTSESSDQGVDVDVDDGAATVHTGGLEPDPAARMGSQRFDRVKTLPMRSGPPAASGHPGPQSAGGLFPGAPRGPRGTAILAQVAPPSSGVPPVSDVGFRVARDNRLRKGRWIIVAAALAAVAVIVLVSVVTGMNMRGGSGGPSPGPPAAPSTPSGVAPSASRSF